MRADLSKIENLLLDFLQGGHDEYRLWLADKGQIFEDEFIEYVHDLGLSELELNRFFRDATFYLLKDLSDRLLKALDGPTEAECDAVNIPILEVFASRWLDDDSPQAEKTFGVKKKR